MSFQPPYHDTINKLLYAILMHFEGNPMNVPLPPYHNVTNRLLYEILQKLNTPAIHPVVYLQFKVLYVSARHGNDATAEPNNISKPYKTITAAKNNYFFGDVIHVMEGIYNEGNLSGNFNYWFDFKTEVNYSGTGAIFHQSFGECYVRGYGKFKCTGDANVINVGNWINCFLDIEAESFESIKKTVVLWQNKSISDPSFYKPHRIKARRAYSSTQSAIHFHYNVHAEVEIDEIISDSVDQQTLIGNNIKKASLKNSRVISNNSSAIMYNANVNSNVVIENCEIVCNYNSPNGHGLILLFWGSDAAIYNTRIQMKHPDAKSIHADFYLNLKIDNNVFSNRDTGGLFPINYVNKGRKIILENNEITLDITGLTSIDLRNYQNADVIRLTSVNVSERVNEIIAAPKHHSFKLFPQSGLVLTLTSADPITTNDSSIILERNRVVLNGSNGDWIELCNNLYGVGNRKINVCTY